jgi:phytoene dehydrogenase-like protein
MKVEVLEAQAVPGGGVRTLELTEPGFHHDFGSAVHPMAASSPFFRTLPLDRYGLQWIEPPAALAHPLDDGTAVLLVRDIEEQARLLGQDGAAWERLFSPFASHWQQLLEDALQPLSLLPRHPLLMARFGVKALLPAATLARAVFGGARARALFAGIAAHSFLSLDQPLSSAFGLMLGASAHAVGWPLPRGGSQSITNALIGHLETLGGTVRTSSAVHAWEQLPPAEVALFDTSPRQLLGIAGDRLSWIYHKRFAEFRAGPGVYKVDYALSEPIPWRARECAQAGTVHLGGTLEEIAASEFAMAHGHHADRPFVLLVQPTLFDPSRAPQGKHIAWAYCHVPHGSTADMLPRIEAQIERFAPGFRECVLARRVLTPEGLEQRDENLIGGDINGGAADLVQFVFRPTWRYYATSDPGIYLCSASTPPGGGVHGMCGHNAARTALRRLSADQRC